jgi:hypothetical protein
MENPPCLDGGNGLFWDRSESRFQEHRFFVSGMDQQQSLDRDVPGELNETKKITSIRMTPLRH